MLHMTQLSGFGCSGTVAPPSGILTFSKEYAPTTASKPTTMGISSDGAFLYSITYDYNQICQFSRNLTTGDLTPLSTAAVASGGGPSGIAIAPDGNHAYVPANQGNVIVIYIRNPSTGELTFTNNSTYLFATGTGSYPTAVAVSPDNKHVYTTLNGTNKVRGYTRNLSTGALTLIGDQTTTGYCNSIAISPDGLHVYVGNTNDPLYIYKYNRNASTGVLSSAATLTVGSAAQGFCISPDGKNVYSSNYWGVLLNSRNASTGVLTNLSPATAGGALNVVSQIITSSGGSTVYALGYNSIGCFTRDSSTGALTEMIPFQIATTGGAASMSMSPDDKFLYTANYTSGKIGIYSIA